MIVRRFPDPALDAGEPPLEFPDVAADHLAGLYHQGLDGVGARLQIARQPHVRDEQAVSEHPDRSVVFLVIALSFLEAEERLAPIVRRARLQLRRDAHRYAVQPQLKARAADD